KLLNALDDVIRFRALDTAERIQQLCRCGVQIVRQPCLQILRCDRLAVQAEIARGSVSQELAGGCDGGVRFRRRPQYRVARVPKRLEPLACRLRSRADPQPLIANDDQTLVAPRPRYRLEALQARGETGHILRM